MNAIKSQSQKPLSYPDRTIKRAKRSLVCSPFTPALFAAMRLESKSLKAISGETGVQNGYTKRPLSELAAENALLWLIEVGILRREVDGQGITDSFRLTPLGRQLIEMEPEFPSHPDWSDRLNNFFTRWLRLPF